MTTGDVTDPTYRYTGRLAGLIEARWQAYWAEHGTFHSPNPVGTLAAQVQVDDGPGASADVPKSFVLDMFAGPSGALHVGHALGYGATDVYARYLRMRGHHVLHAFGFDAFGLPAEQYAVQTGQHPRATTEQNIATIASQLRRLGMGYDQRRSVSTTDVPFYRWTQWIFLQIFHSWYDEDQHRARPIADLVDAFESGTRPTPDGRPWAALTEAERRTVVDSHRLAYLDEVSVNWCPALGTVLANEEVTEAGRSERGNFPVFPRLMRQWMLRITAYADRLVDDLDLLDWPESIKAQQRHWIGRTQHDPRTDGGAGGGGVTYRMRDWVFSRQRYWGEPFPIVYDEHGPVALPESMLPVVLPETHDFAPRTYDPDDADSEPEAPLARLGEWVSVRLDLGDGQREYRRETHTMPQWAGSCWYELRYADPDNDQAFCDPVNERYWMGPQGKVDGDISVRRVDPRESARRDPGGVDLYVGGVEHAVLHLLYARFWHKVLYDLGHVSSSEPFRRLVTNGYIQAYSYTDSRGVYVPAAEVEERDGRFWWHGQAVDRALGKIGKSLRNMITPDEMCEEYGADTFRVYVQASGPLRVSRPWDPQGIVGAQRFLQRVWRTVVDEDTGGIRVADVPMQAATRSLLHKTIATVRTEMEELAFNTAIARLMELARHATGLTELPRALAEPMVLMLAPFAPHLAEELWRRLGHPHSLAYEPYPEADPHLVTERTGTCVVQVAGRLRDRLEVSVDIDEEELRTRALASARVQRALAGRPVRRVVVRGYRLVNVVPG